MVEWFTSVAGKKKVKGELPDEIRLSPSMMKLLFDCKACLYKHVRGYRRPSFPVAGITHGVDKVAKELCDLHRTSGTVPLMLRAGLEGGLLSEKPQNIVWADEELKCTIVGKLDEIVVERDGAVAPLDHKSCYKPPPTIIPATQLQLDVYSLLLSRSDLYAHLPTSEYAYLLYHYPVLEKSVGSPGRTPGCPERRMGFASLLRRARAYPENALEVIRETLDVIRGPKPEPAPDCAYCEWTRI